MKIIKYGIPTKMVYEGSCTCGTVFQADEGDGVVARFGYQDRGTTYYSCPCPVCHRIVDLTQKTVPVPGPTGFGTGPT